MGLPPLGATGLVTGARPITAAVRGSAAFPSSRPTGYSMVDAFEPAQRAAAAPDEKTAAPGPLDSFLSTVGDIGKELLDLLTAVNDVITMIANLFSGTETKTATMQQPQADPAPEAEPAPAPEPAPEPAADPAPAPADQPADGINPFFNQALQIIGGDAEGAKLIDAAKKAGLRSIQIGDLAQGEMGETKDGRITISPNAANSFADFIHTLAHELGHAATPQDGDSIDEEKTVDALAQRIQSRVSPGQTYKLDVNSYKDLDPTNAIHNSLAAIGITA